MTPARPRQPSAGVRVTWAMLGGAVTGVVVSLFTVPTASIRLPFLHVLRDGMTFQVSDTNITSKPIRRIALHHALLSCLSGAVLPAIVVHVVATLLK